MTKLEQSKLIIEIPTKLHKKLKHEAIDADMTLREYIINILGRSK